MEIKNKPFVPIVLSLSLVGVVLSCVSPNVRQANAPGLGVDTCILVTTRYRNDSIYQSGQECNSVKQGKWHEFYADGSLRWEGTYVNGIPTRTPVPARCTVMFSDSFNPKSDSILSFRVVPSGIHPHELLVGVNDGRVTKSNDPDNYDYDIHLGKKASVTVTVFDRGRRNAIISEKTIIIHP
jgi:hypothetical protein